MQSVYLFEKKRKASEEVAKEQERAKQYKENRSKSKIELANKYNKRMQKLLLSLPDEIKNPPKAVHCQSSKYFITNYSTELQRIEAACNNNKWLDTTPTPKASYILRKRERNKELSSDLRFRPATSAERIRDSRHWQMSILNTSTNNNTLYSGGRTILDYYHPISHLKTLKSLALFTSDKR